MTRHIPSRRLEREPAPDPGAAAPPAPSPAAAGWVRTLRAVAIAAGLSATLVALGRIGYWRIFSLFGFHDDEGCLLITVRSFMDGHALYDEVFSMYGPFPVLVRALLFAGSGQPVGHDLGRLFSLANWLATATVGGAVAWRLSGSLLAGWIALLVVFHTLWQTAYEPGHPQELCALLLVLAVWLSSAATSDRRRRAAAVAAGLGVLGGCLAMSKINVACFFVAAVIAAALACVRRSPTAIVLQVLSAAGVLALPVLLMRTRFDVPEFRSFALYVTLSLAPVVLLAYGRSTRPFIGVRHGLWFAARLLASVAAVAAAMLATGTTLRALLDGVVLIPLRAGTRFIVPLPYFADAWPIALGVGLVAVIWLAIERWGVASRTLPAACSAAFRAAYAGASLTWPHPQGEVQFSHLFVFGLPSAVLLLMPRAFAERPPGEVFARHVLAFLAVTESMWAFPVGGSQVSFASLLAALVLVIVVADGCRDLAALLRRWVWWPSRVMRLVVSAAVVALLVPILSSEDAHFRDRYTRRAPLGLRGAEAIHIEPDIASYYREVTEALQALPDTFFTFPGMYSFYFWADRDPPTTLNLTNWMYVFDDRQQERVVADLAAHPALRVLVSHRLIGFWNQGKALSGGPLVRYIDAGFSPERELGQASLWAPNPPGTRSSSRLPIAADARR